MSNCFRFVTIQEGVACRRVVSGARHATVIRFVKRNETYRDCIVRFFWIPCLMLLATYDYTSYNHNYVSVDPQDWKHSTRE